MEIQDFKITIKIIIIWEIESREVVEEEAEEVVAVETVDASTVENKATFRENALMRENLMREETMLAAIEVAVAEVGAEEIMIEKKANLQEVNNGAIMMTIIKMKGIAAHQLKFKAQIGVLVLIMLGEVIINII